MSTPQITVSERAQEHIRVQVQQTRTNFLRLGVKRAAVTALCTRWIFSNLPNPTITLSQ